MSSGIESHKHELLDEPTTLVEVRLPSEDVKEIREVAEVEGVTLATIIRRGVQKVLEEVESES